MPSISVVPLSREHRRYFYVKDRTGASQWDFPTEDDKEEDLKDGQGTQTQTSSQVDTKTSASGVTGKSVITAADLRLGENYWGVERKITAIKSVQYIFLCCNCIIMLISLFFYCFIFKQRIYMSSYCPATATSSAQSIILLVPIPTSTS